MLPQSVRSVKSGLDSAQHCGAMIVRVSRYTQTSLSVVTDDGSTVLVHVKCSHAAQRNCTG